MCFENSFHKRCYFRKIRRLLSSLEDQEEKSVAKKCKHLLKDLARNFNINSTAVGYGERMLSWYKKSITLDAIGENSMALATIRSTKSLNSRLFASSGVNIRAWRSRSDFMRHRNATNYRNRSFGKRSSDQKFPSYFKRGPHGENK